MRDMCILPFVCVLSFAVVAILHTLWVSQIIPLTLINSLMCMTIHSTTTDCGLTHKTLGLLIQIIGILPNIATKLGTCSSDVHVGAINFVKEGFLGLQSLFLVFCGLLWNTGTHVRTLIWEFSALEYFCTLRNVQKLNARNIFYNKEEKFYGPKETHVLAAS